MINVLLFWIMALFFICSSSGCGLVSERSPGKAQFQKIYEQAGVQPDAQASNVKPSPLITLSADGIPLPSLLRTISDQCGISIIAAQSLDSLLVSLEVKNASADEVLATVSRRMEQRLTKVGSVYYIGQISPEDRGFLIRRIRRLNKIELDDIIKSFHSEYGRSSVTDDGIIVVTDRVEILERLTLALNQLESLDVQSWIMQLYVISISETSKHDLGLDLDSTAKLSLAFSDLKTPTLNLTGGFTALLNSVHNDSSSKLTASPMMILRDGVASKLSKGETTPIPQKTVSPQGTVSTTGYTYINTGLTVSALLREESATSAHASFDLELSAISGFVDESIPIVRKQVLTTQANLRSGGVYLIGSLNDDQDTDSLGGKIAPSVYSSSKNQSELQIWAKVYRIASPVLATSIPVLEN